MRIALTIYEERKDDEAYALMIGRTILDNIGEHPIITAVKFDQAAFDVWRKDRTDTSDMRASWAAFCASPSEHARSFNTRTKKNCAVCGKEFEGTGKAKFCSNACAQKDSRAKRRAME